MVYRYIYVTDANSDATLNGELPLTVAIGSTCRTWDHLQGLLHEIVGRSPYDDSMPPAFMVKSKVARRHGDRYVLGTPKFNLVELFEKCEVLTGEQVHELYEFQGEGTIEPDALLLRIRLFDGTSGIGIPVGPTTARDWRFCLSKKSCRQQGTCPYDPRQRAGLAFT